MAGKAGEQDKRRKSSFFGGAKEAVGGESNDKQHKHKVMPRTAVTLQGSQSKPGAGRKGSQGKLGVRPKAMTVKQYSSFGRRAPRHTRLPSSPFADERPSSPSACLHAPPRAAVPQSSTSAQALRRTPSHV